MPFYIGDYLRDTQHLNTEKHGAYMLLIMAYWASGKPLPDEDEHLATICRLPLERWQIVRPTIERFFRVANGEWRHRRIDAELARSVEITEKRRAAGMARAQQTASKRPAHAEQVNQQNAIPSQSQIQKKDSPPVSPPLGGDAREVKARDRSQRGTRLPTDWQPTPEDRDFARTLELDPDEVAAEFRDYWTGIAGRFGVKLDWSGTYRNRCRELAKRGPRSPVQRLGPATGIAQGFADALRLGPGEPHEDRGAYQPPPRALLGGQRG